MTLILAARNTAGKAIKSLKAQTRSLGQQLRTSLGQQLVAALSFGTILYQIRQLTNETINLQNALTGLQVVSQSFNRDVDRTREAAERLAKDGFITVGEAAKSMQNLLATGFNIEEAERMIQATKAAAAFNRQAGLQFGEAVVRATEGVRMGMSTLSDAAGIATNLSTMLKRHGLAPDQLSNLQQSAEARRAIFTEWINDANAEMENLAALAKTSQGEILKAAAATRRQRQEIGASMMKLRQGFEQMKVWTWQLVDAVIRAFEQTVSTFSWLVMRIQHGITAFVPFIKQVFGEIVQWIMGQVSGLLGWIQQHAPEKIANLFNVGFWKVQSQQTEAWAGKLAEEGAKAMRVISRESDAIDQGFWSTIRDINSGGAITVPDTNASGRDRSGGGSGGGGAFGSVMDPRVSLAASIGAVSTAPGQVSPFDRQAMAQRFLDQMRNEMDRVGLTVNQLSGDLRDRLNAALKTAGMSVEDFSGAVDGVGDAMEMTADQILGTIGNIGHTVARMSQGKISGMGGFSSIAGALSGVLTGGIGTALTAGSIAFGFADALQSTGHRDTIREGVGMAIEDHADKFQPGVTLVTEGQGNLASLDRLEDMIAELQRRGSPVTVRANG